MKKLLSLLFVVCLLLAGCGSPEPETVPTTEIPTEVTTEATAEPTTEPTTVPTEPPVYYNPLTGEEIDEPYTGRIFANTICNTQDAVPHVGVNDADILFETLGSTGVVRCLALFTDVTKAQAIGATRSTRMVFNDLVQHYDAVLTHAGGYYLVLDDANARGIDHFNLDQLYRSTTDPLAAGTGYRETGYKRYSPNNLFAIGQGIYDYAVSRDINLTQPEDKDYCLTFAEDGTPFSGEDAMQIRITFGQHTKRTTMIYDEASGKYTFNQYGKLMTDVYTGEPETFRNVLVLRAENTWTSIYPVVDLVTGGEGYFACGGKYIPILWNCADENSPLRFTTVDGEPLDLGVGNSYIAIINYTNEVEIFAEKPE